MSLRVFVEIPDQSYLQRKGSPGGIPDGAAFCAEAGCWVRESDGLLIEDSTEAAAERMLRVYLSEKPAARSEGAYRMLMLRLLDAAACRESR